MENRNKQKIKRKKGNKIINGQRKCKSRVLQDKYTYIYVYIIPFVAQPRDQWTKSLFIKQSRCATCYHNARDK